MLKGRHWPASPLEYRLSLYGIPCVMPGLVPGIHVLAAKRGVDGRDKPGHDGGGCVR